MFIGGDMKGWQAVPIIIPSFLIISIATIWYFSFHHFKNRPRPQNLTSPLNSSSRPSRTSDVGMTGPRNSDHLVHLIDIPPLPAIPYSDTRRDGRPVPNAALRAQRSRETIRSSQSSDRYSGGRQGRSHVSVNSDAGSAPGSDRPHSYVIDLGTPPPIPAAHLYTPISSRNSSERPSPLTPMKAMTSSQKRKPALHLNLSLDPTLGPLSHLTASRGSMNDMETTMVAGNSATSTTTPSISALDLPDIIAQNPPLRERHDTQEPEKIFVVKDPNFIFPSIQRERNPAALPEFVPRDLRSEEKIAQKSTTKHRSHKRSLSASLRTFIHAQASSHPQGPNTDSESQARPSISGPSLYTFSRCSPEWSITKTDVYRNASPILNPLIEHPDLDKGYQRPKEWGVRTSDLIEAEIISGQMRRIERLRKEREFEREKAWERQKQGRRSDKGKEVAEDLEDEDEEWEEVEDFRDHEDESAPFSARNDHEEMSAGRAVSEECEDWPLGRADSEARRAPF